MVVHDAHEQALLVTKNLHTFDWANIFSLPASGVISAPQHLNFIRNGDKSSFDLIPRNLRSTSIDVIRATELNAVWANNEKAWSFGNIVSVKDPDIGCCLNYIFFLAYYTRILSSYYKTYTSSLY